MKTNAEIVRDIQAILAEFPALPLPAMPFRTIDDIERARRDAGEMWTSYWTNPMRRQLDEALARYDAADDDEQRRLYFSDVWTYHAVNVRKANVFHALESWPFREAP